VNDLDNYEIIVFKNSGEVTLFNPQQWIIKVHNYFGNCCSAKWNNNNQFHTP